MDNTIKIQRHARLSWTLIEHKILYYAPRGIGEAFINHYRISDDAYDILEQEYLALCLELGLPNTVVHKEYFELEVPGPGMHEVDFSRPSVWLAYGKLEKLEKEWMK